MKTSEMKKINWTKAVMEDLFLGTDYEYRDCSQDYEEGIFAVDDEWGGILFRFPENKRLFEWKIDYKWCCVGKGNIIDIIFALTEGTVDIKTMPFKDWYQEGKEEDVEWE